MGCYSNFFSILKVWCSWCSHLKYFDGGFVVDSGGDGAFFCGGEEMWSS